MSRNRINESRYNNKQTIENEKAKVHKGNKDMHYAIKEQQNKIR